MIIRQLFVIIFSLTAIVASALTLREAHEAAEKHYPLVRDYDLIEAAGIYTIENASKAWQPQVNVSGRLSLQSASPAFPEVLTEMMRQRGVNAKGLGKLQYRAGVDIDQTIWDGGAVKASRKVAEAETREALRSTDVEMYAVKGRVNDLFFGILLLEQHRDAVEKTMELLDKNLALMETLERNGAAMRSDVDAVKVERVAAAQQMVNIESALGSYRKMLALYTALPEDVALEEPVEIPYDRQDVFSLRPEMSLLSAQEGLAEARRAQVKASVMPRVGAFVQGFFGYPGYNNMKDMLSRDPSFNAMVGVKAVWNLGSLYTRGNKLRLLDNSIGRIETARRVFDFNATLQATGCRQEIERLRRLGENDAEIVALRRSIRQASEAQLREGIVKPTDLLLRITEEENAVITAKTNHIEYLNAVYRLEYIMNRL